MHFEVSWVYNVLFSAKKDEFSMSLSGEEIEVNLMDLTSIVNSSQKWLLKYYAEFLEGNFTCQEEFQNILKMYRPLTFETNHSCKIREIIDPIMAQVNDTIEKSYDSNAFVIRALIKVNYFENYKGAIEDYEIARQAGNPQAMNNLATIYCNGEGVEINSQLALTLYEQAIKLGCSNALINMANMIRWGEHGSYADILKAIDYYVSAIKQGNDRGQRYLGFICLRGNGSLLPNCKLASEYFDKAIATGCSWAMLFRATLYYEGRESEKNFNEAIKLFEQAIVRGCVVGFNELGLMYWKSWNANASQSDLSKAIGYFEQGILFHEPYSLYNWALIHKQEKPRKAWQYIRQAAERQHKTSIKILEESLPFSFPHYREYHYQMLQKQYDNVADEVINTEGLFDECFVFECESIGDDMTLLEAVFSILNSIQQKSPSFLDSNKMITIIRSLDENEKIRYRDDFTAFKHRYYAQINPDELNITNCICLMNLIIDEWYARECCNEFASRFCSLLEKSLSHDEHDDSTIEQSLLKNSVILIIRVHWGSDFGVQNPVLNLKNARTLIQLSLVEPRPEYKGVNDALGFKLIISRDASRSNLYDDKGFFAQRGKHGLDDEDLDEYLPSAKRKRLA